MNNRARQFLLILFVMVFTTTAFANGGTYHHPKFHHPHAVQHALGHWLIRAHAYFIVPDVGSGIITGIGGRVTGVSKQTVPELDISYFLTHHFALELILGTSRHHITAENTIAGRVPLGKVSMLPPTITLQYHFFPGHMFSPYVGIGINYTIFYDVDSGPIARTIEYSNNFGPAAQAGVDVYLGHHWLFNVDVKRVSIETTATVGVPAALGVGPAVIAHVRISPWMYGVGFGYRFS